MIKETTYGSYESTGFYCMVCGDNKNMWRALSGDFYQGEKHICLSCGHHLNTCGVYEEDKHSKTIKEDLQNEQTPLS